jgi:hypothetical protein
MSMNTVFVIGAGASKEANLPTGDDFKNKISLLLNIHYSVPSKLKSGDNLIFQALRIFANNIGSPDITLYINEALHIKDALPLAISIDNFIDAHRNNEKIALCGKLAIVRSILNAERDSRLYFDKSLDQFNIDLNSISNTWYVSFFQLLTENCEKNDLKERFKFVTLIIFNYDRCVEHFIYCALQTYYKISGTEAAELVKSINIYHPYGVVGTMPWINQNEAMPFEMEPNSQKLLDLAKNIKTFAEGTDPSSSEILAIKEHMKKAKRIAFLGFAFHKLNMQLIDPGPSENSLVFSRSDIRCYATTLDRSESDKQIIEGRINHLYRSTINVTMANKSCNDFFKDFSLGLSF